MRALRQHAYAAYEAVFFPMYRDLEKRAQMRLLIIVIVTGDQPDGELDVAIVGLPLVVVRVRL